MSAARTLRSKLIASISRYWAVAMTASEDIRLLGTPVVKFALAKVVQSLIAHQEEAVALGKAFEATLRRPLHVAGAPTFDSPLLEAAAPVLEILRGDADVTIH